jgi:alkylation response protein AidB-like acyl-CoA dehydrogenase
MPLTAKTPGSSVLTDDMLERFWERAPGYDQENRFFQEDFDELKEAGYYLSAVPTELGGLGMNLAEVCQEQRRLAYYAPATALASNMHLYWTGLIADIWRSGDTSLEWLLKGAAEGEIYAAGHAESGNDVPLLYSSTRAERVDGGYRFTGRKSFGSMGPAWTWLGIHGMDTDSADGPKVVHAFFPRDAEGVTYKSTWDGVLGMRATRSDDTILDGLFVPDEHIARVVPAGFAGIDQFVLGIFAWALIAFGNIYYGLAHRVFDIVVEQLKGKSSYPLPRGMVHHPEAQHDIADMALELERIAPHLDVVAQEYSDGVDYGPAWGPRIVAAKYCAVESAWNVVDKAFEVTGGFGIFPASHLERLFRDARLGRLHPANAHLTREIMAKAYLGLDLDEQPRWG